MKNHIFYTIAILGVLLVGTSLPVAAQSGASCENPIPLGREYSEHITGMDTVWYVANSFDLTLTVKYYPNDNMAAPDLYMDFSCTPGVYGDSIICGLFCTENAIVQLHYHVTPVWKLDDNNNVYYEVSMGEWYRNVLLEHGISYNVEILIKAVYYGRGDITLTPDAEFSECMETDQWLLLGRTLSVAPDDDSTYFIAPYANWAEDSVRYIWSGAQPATVVIGTICDFDPLDGLDDRRIDVLEMKAGRDTVNHTNADIAYYMTYMQNPDNTAKGGIFYVKVVSAGVGSLKVEHMPETPPDGDATLLEYSKATMITGDTASLYAIPRTWTSATRFDTPTDHVFKMYIGTTADFYLKDAIATCPYNAAEDGHWFGFLQSEMEALWEQTSQKYLYVRFACSKAATVTPTLWEPSECVGKTTPVRRNTTLDIESRSRDIYRFYYNDWKDGAMTVAWDNSTQCKMLVSGDCTIGTSEYADAVFYYKGLNEIPHVISASTMAQWADYVDADGYFYMRFYTTSFAGGEVTITTDAPEETDPEDEPEPVIRRATVYITCLEDNTGVQVHVSIPQTIRINDASGTEIWQQMVQPAQPQSVPLPPGIYTLIGENEQVEIQL